MENQEVSRRDVLKLGLIGLLGVAGIAGCESSKSEEMKKYGYDRINKDKIKLANGCTCEAHRDKKGDIDRVYIYDDATNGTFHRDSKEFYTPGTYKPKDRYFDELCEMVNEKSKPLED
ncbi:MAG: hypothetical protein Q8N99_01860 [Nanoarchaeota archaeon]|nr:hypothetical protein [Nanoarchaeota archaeon]